MNFQDTTKSQAKMGVKPEIEFSLGLGYQLPTTKRQPPPPISAPISMGRWDSDNGERFHASEIPAPPIE